MGNLISSVGNIVGQVGAGFGDQINNTPATPKTSQNFGQPIYNAGTTQLNPNFANNANQINTSVQDPNLVQQQVTDALYKQQTQFLDPQFQRSQSALENQLANQGITQGSEAWNNAMQMANAQKQQAYESARNSAINAGVNAGSTMFGNQLAGAQFGNKALGQQFNQGLTAQQAGNTAQNQTFAQQLANAQLNNQAVQQANALQVQRENAAKMADAMSKQGLYGLGGALLGSPSGMKTAGNVLGSLGSLGSSALSGLGGLFGNSSAALPDWASGITDTETLNALGLGGGGLGSFGGLFGAAAPWLGGAAALDKLTGGGVSNAVGDLANGAGNIVSDIGSSIGDVFGW